MHMIRKVPELSNIFLPPCAQLLHEHHHGKAMGLLVPCLSSGCGQKGDVGWEQQLLGEGWHVHTNTRTQ